MYLIVCLKLLLTIHNKKEAKQIHFTLSVNQKMLYVRSKLIDRYIQWFDFPLSHINK